MVTVNTSQIYAYNGSLTSLLGLDVAPSFTRLSATITDTNGVLTTSDDTTISLNGGATQNLNFVSAGTVSGVLGVTGTTQIAVFTVPGSPNMTYLYAPNGLPNLLGATVLYTYDLDQTSFALPTTTVGVVDGTDGNDTMAVGYTDADGDQITNSGLLFTGNDTIDGKGGNDSISAGSGNDSVLGGAGNDTLYGQAGNDTLLGGDGNDLIQGGAGSDSMVGGTGSDTLDYSDNTANVTANLLTNTVSGGTATGDTISGFENVIGGSGNDTLTLSNTSGSAVGGAGNDSIIGGTGNDTIDGGAGNDTMRGGAGNDVFLNGGGTGNDSVFGGDGDDIWRAGGTDSGNDQVFLEGGNDFAEVGYLNTSSSISEILDGGTGQDTISFDAASLNNANLGITLNESGNATNIGFITEVRNFEHVRGNGGANQITGNSLNNELVGLGGNDTLIGNAGNDTLDGGDGADSLSGGADNDLILGGAGNDTIDGGSGNDTISGGAGMDSILAGLGSDTIDGGADRDTYRSDLTTQITVSVDDSGNGNVTSGGDTDQVTSVENYVAAEIAGQIDTINFTTRIDSISDITGIDDGAQNGTAVGTFTTGGGRVIAFGGTGQPSYDTIIANIGANLYPGGGTISITGGDESGQVGNISFENFEQINISVVCFAKGTLIETDRGQLRVEALLPGIPVRTMDHGYQPLKWLGNRKLEKIDLLLKPKLRPVRISAGALGSGLPEQDLLVSPQHRILIRSKISQRMFGKMEVLMPANKLTCIEGIDVAEDIESVEYFHMLFERHEIVFSNGAATESLFTGPEALKSMNPEAREEIEALFPEICEENFEATPARYIPEKGKDMKKLAERHQTNRKPLYA